MNRAMRCTLAMVAAALGCRDTPPTGQDDEAATGSGIQADALGESQPAAEFVVNAVDDVDDGACSVAHCSLREAINAANASAGLDGIVFDVRGRPVARTIRPLSALPTITEAVLIDGYTQQGASPNTNPPALGSNAVLMIELDGSAGSAPAGLEISAGNSVVRGLVINRFGTGVVLHTNGGNAIEGNFLGTDVRGTAQPSPFNSSTGVAILGAPDNRIGGITAAARNVISAQFRGIAITGSGVAGTRIQGNLIGTDATGSVALTVDVFNSNGIRLEDVSSVTVGGTTPEERNVISGNAFGVFVAGSAATGVAVQGNFIGTDATGNAALGNDRGGIVVEASASIGGTAPGSGNVISGNGVGVTLTGSGSVVQGNLIGTDVTGTIALGNGDGVEVLGANNSIGGTGPGARNVISGGFRGISVRGGGSAGTMIQGNYIGTDITGTLSLGNSNGIRMEDVSTVTVGGTVAEARNVVSGNGYGVVVLGSSATGVSISGNFIGTDISGSAALGNQSDGILAGSGATIGGTAPGAGNVISANGFNGVSASDGSVVQGNLIGTDLNGSVDLGNGFAGVSVTGSDNVIGGTVAGARNLISGNDQSGVFILSGANNLVQGNRIGTDITGTSAVGNFEGVRIHSTANTIGGTVPGARNLISGNHGAGIDILGGSGTGNLVQGNLIGGDAAGTAALGNSGPGLLIESASGNTIGGSAPAAGNVILGNGGAGVVLSSGGSSGNLVQGNTITANGRAGVELSLTGNGNAIRSNSTFSNGGLGIDLDTDGVTLNDPGDGDAGSNDRQNFPVLASVTTGKGRTTITGTIESMPSTEFVVEFFANGECDPSNHGEGARLLGSTRVTTRNTGSTQFRVTLSTPLPAGHPFVTATATDPFNSTSEFSQCFSG